MLHTPFASCCMLSVECWILGRYYSAGDAGFRDEHGYLHIMARTDDIINVSGHRLSTGQLEEACLATPRVVECAVVGVADALKGSVPVAFLVVAGDTSDEQATAAVVKDAIQHVRTRVGPIADLKQACVVKALPKTRSGKILRKIMRQIADDEPYKVPGTIEDASVVDDITVSIEALGYGSARQP